MEKHSALTRRGFLGAAAGAGLALGLAREIPAAGKKKKSGGAAPWKAGVGSVCITPDKPVWMGGFAARKTPSEGKIHDIRANALALEDSTGAVSVLVAVDIIGIPSVSAAKIAEAVKEKHGLPRERLMLCASHTHSGPVLANPFQILYRSRMSEAQWADVEAYNERLIGMIIDSIDAAMKDRRPARVGFGRGTAGFAVNRREKTETGYKIGVNPAGPVDRDVPVLRVEDEQGALRAVVMGLACHNTTLGADNLRICGDYAGFAKAALEQKHPGARAFYVAGCGADANPYPRGTIELATKHGEELAAAVEKVLGEPMAPVRGPLKAAFEEVPLALSKISREELQKRLTEKDEVRKAQAEELLKILERDGRLPAEYPYALQAWQFGRDLTLVALSCEVVVDYSLRLKKELGPERLWVAAYCNDVVTYIPSVRVLREGGYEAGEAMNYLRLPGPWADSVEETVIGKAHELVRRVGRE